ncbi:MAG: amino acid ABC transporter permease [Pseudomonadota bacterium]
MSEAALQDDGGLLRYWRDKRARAVIIQILVMAGLFAAVSWLISNAIANLQQLDKSFGFDFLWGPASYDINQTLIEYDSRMPHYRAALVGILNTALVAFCGIILATIIGFILGVMRLSSNWLVSRIVYVYIEVTRNVPLLVQILLWHAVVVHSFPHPKQAIILAEGWALSNRGLYIPKPIFEPQFWAVAAAFVVAVVVAVLFAGWAKRQQNLTGKIYPVFWVNLGLIIGLPVIAYYAAGQPISFDMPELGRFRWQGGLAILPEFAALWWALSLYTAAFIAEIVRAGIQAVSHGQTEAASSLGLRPGRVLRLVVIPQALRVIVPPLTSQYLNLTKNSSLAIAIGYMDIVATLGGITLNQSGKEMECMILVLLLYLSFSLTISLFMNWYNKRIALVER